MLASWSNGNSITAALAKSRNPDVSSSASVQSSSPAITFRQNYDYDSFPVRKLLNQSHRIFTQFSASVEESERNKFTSVGVLQETSKEFRVIIRACCQSLEREISEIDYDQQDQSKFRQLQSLARVYRHIEIIWSLCDVLFFRPQGDFLAPDLLEWSRWNFVQPDEDVKEMLEWQRSEGIAGLEQHEKYWNTVFLFLLVGRVESAQKLLSAHSRASFDPAFGAVVELLDGFPLSTPSRPSDHNAFLIWREDVKRCLEDGYLMGSDQRLESICRLLLGDESTLRQLFVDLRPTWYQLLVGRMIYTQPHAKLFDLLTLAEECLEMVADFGLEWSGLDKTLLALFRLDILSALKELCASFRNWWCAAHLSVLLRHGGCSELLTVKQDIDLCEYLLFEYGESLMTSDLWEIAVDYLAACPTYGMNALRLAIERMTFSSSDYYKVLKVLALCRKYDLLDTAKSICKEKSISALKSGKFDLALTWCLQTKDGQFATYIAEQMMRIDNGSGRIQELHILDGLGESALISPSVTFVVKYRQMHSLKSNGSLKESASLLTELICSQIAPRSFWMVLFRDFMDLIQIQDKEVLFEPAEIYSLMDILQTAVNEMEYVKNTNFYQSLSDHKSMKDDLNRFRLTLVHSLSNALFQKIDF